MRSITEAKHFQSILISPSVRGASTLNAAGDIPSKENLMREKKSMCRCYDTH
jgi:hypothetical protein